MHCVPVSQPSSSIPTDIRNRFYAEDHPDFVYPGDGTFAPFGFTLAQLDYIFYNVKKFQVTGTLPGQYPTETSLLGFPLDGLRQHIFSQVWTHVTPYVGPTSEPFIPDLQINRTVGVFYEDKYWPFIQLEFIGNEGSVEAETYQSGRYGTNISLAPFEPFPVGTVHLLGEEAILYGFGEPDPPGYNRGGEVFIEVEELWS